MRLVLTIAAVAILFALLFVTNRLLRNVTKKALYMAASAVACGVFVGAGGVLALQIVKPEADLVLRLILYFLLFSAAGAFLSERDWESVQRHKS